MKEWAIYGVIGTVCGAIATALGGWDTALQTLVIFMIIDWVTGFVVAGVFKKSKKSKSGALESVQGFKGLFKKGMMLLIVLIGHHLDVLIGFDFVRYAIIIAFVINEVISIIENAELMGIPLHKLTILKKTIGMLGEKTDAESRQEKTDSGKDDD